MTTIQLIDHKGDIKIKKYITEDAAREAMKKLSVRKTPIRGALLLDQHGRILDQKVR